MSNEYCKVTVYEYEYLVWSDEAKLSSRMVLINEQTWRYLKQLCLQQGEQRKLFRLCSVDGLEAIQVRNYGGVINTPDGCQIEILPKITSKRNEGDGVEHSRASLLNMLRSLPAFRHIQIQDANLATQKMPLLEVFIGQFLGEVNRLIKRGLRKEYQSAQDNLTFLRGKLLLAKQLQVNCVNQHRFFVEHDDYQLNRPANRIIRTALEKVSVYTQNSRHQKLLKELLFVFTEVPKSHHIKSDFTAIKLERGMHYYRQVLDWSRLILEGFSPLTMMGKHHSFSLLFPLESVFESYVAHVLSSLLPNEINLSSQIQNQSLVRFKEKSLFRLKPDLYISGSEQDLVLDTKWKLISPDSKQSSMAFGLSQSDFYQMFAYGHKYLNGSGEMLLIYPKQDEFSHPVEWSFDYSNELKLWVVPFDVSAGIRDSSRMLLPAKCALRNLIS